MSTSNGVIRIGRKGLKKFAFGDEPAFEIDVVTAMHQWIEVDEEFRVTDEGVGSENAPRTIPTASMPDYHRAAVAFVKMLGGGDVTVAEALDFLARLREQYDELATFFQPKLRGERDSPATSEADSAFRFSVEDQATTPES